MCAHIFIYTADMHVFKIICFFFLNQKHVRRDIYSPHKLQNPTAFVCETFEIPPTDSQQKWSAANQLSLLHAATMLPRYRPYALWYCQTCVSRVTPSVCVTALTTKISK